LLLKANSCKISERSCCRLHITSHMRSCSLAPNFRNHSGGDLPFSLLFFHFFTPFFLRFLFPLIFSTLRRFFYRLFSIRKFSRQDAKVVVFFFFFIFFCSSSSCSPSSVFGADGRSLNRSSLQAWLFSASRKHAEASVYSSFTTRCRWSNYLLVYSNVPKNPIETKRSWRRHLYKLLTVGADPVASHCPHVVLLSLTNVCSFHCNRHPLAGHRRRFAAAALALSSVAAAAASRGSRHRLSIASAQSRHDKRLGRSLEFISRPTFTVRNAVSGSVYTAETCHNFQSETFQMGLLFLRAKAATAFSAS